MTQIGTALEISEDLQQQLDQRGWRAVFAKMFGSRLLGVKLIDEKTGRPIAWGRGRSKDAAVAKALAGFERRQAQGKVSMES